MTRSLSPHPVQSMTPYPASLGSRAFPVSAAASVLGRKLEPRPVWKCAAKAALQTATLENPADRARKLQSADARHHPCDKSREVRPAQPDTKRLDNAARSSACTCPSS